MAEENKNVETLEGQGAEEQNTPLSALIDPGKLDQQFNVKEAGTADGRAGGAGATGAAGVQGQQR